MGIEPDSPATIAADGERLRAVLARRIEVLIGSPVAVTRCEVTGDHAGRDAARYRYDVGLRRLADGAEREVVLTAVVPARDAGRRNDEALARLGPIPVAGGVIPLPAFWTVPELGMFVEVFPHDRRLSALARIVLEPAGAVARGMAHEPNRAGWTTADWRAETVQHRPGKRATVRLTGRSAAAEATANERTLYAKVYGDPETGTRTHEVLRALHAGSAGRFFVGEPLACLDEGSLLLHEEVPGARLLDVLRADDPATAMAAVRQAGRAIAALHRLDVEAIAQPPQRDPLSAVEALGSTLRAAFSDQATAIDETVGAVLAGAGAAPVLVPIHGDLKPEHIRIDADRVGFIDFDRYCRADPMQDLAYLLFRVARAGDRSWRRQAAAAALVPALLESYFETAPARWGRRLPAQYAVLALSKAATFAAVGAGGGRSNDAAKVAELIAEAREALAGRAFSEPASEPRRGERRNRG